MINEEYEKHLEELSADGSFQPVYNSVADVSNRSGMTRKKYESARPNESISRSTTQSSLRENIFECTSAYDRIGIIKSIIDLMSEFVAAGITIVHEDETPNEFYKSWQKRVHLEDRAERFASWLLKAGNVVVRRMWGNIKNTRISSLQNVNPEAGHIPIKYQFYHPGNVEVIGDYMAGFSSKPRYGLRLASNNSMFNRPPATEAEKQVFDALPEEIKNAILYKKTLKGHYVVALNPNDIYVDHYKKDDQDIWAKPMLYSVLSDIYYNDKVKLAKTATLDNMINAIRLWKLGDHTKDLFPTAAESNKLTNILMNNTGGGPVDIIWNSMIELQEFYPPIDKLVNFKENTEVLLLGMGFPIGLLGGTEGTSGKASTGGNSMSLKQVMTRMAAIRRAIVSWLEGEIDIIQKNMGYRKRPQILFSNSDLHEEKNYFDLLLDLVDRNILSEERVLRIINESPEIERSRIRQETKMRESGDMPEKASPYFNPQVKEQREHELQKINSNNLSKERPLIKSDGKPGRPFNARDSVPRIRRSQANLITAKRNFDFIDSWCQDTVLKKWGLDNLRQLSSDAKRDLDSLRIIVLAACPADATLNADSIVKMCKECEEDVYASFMSEYRDSLIPDMTTEEKRLLLFHIYKGE